MGERGEGGATVAVLAVVVVGGEGEAKEVEEGRDAVASHVIGGEGGEE